MGALGELSDCREFRVTWTCWNTTSFHRSEHGCLVGLGAAILAWEMRRGISRSICLSAGAGIYWMSKDTGCHPIATLQWWSTRRSACGLLQRWYFRLKWIMMLPGKVNVGICWRVGLHFTRLPFSQVLLTAHWHTDYYANSQKCLSVVCRCWSIHSYNLLAFINFLALGRCKMLQE